MIQFELHDMGDYQSMCANIVHIGNTYGFNMPPKPPRTAEPSRLMGYKGDEPVPVMSIPVPYSKKEQLLPVPMSMSVSGPHVWTTLDFTSHSQKKFTGMYTNEQSACAAILVLQRGGEGHLLQADMIHQGGGFNIDAIESMPNIKEGVTVEVILKLGATDEGKVSLEALDEFKKKFGFNGEIQLFACAEEQERMGGLCVLKNGIVGEAGSQEHGFKSVMGNVEPSVKLTQNSNLDKATEMAYVKKLLQGRYDSEHANQAEQAINRLLPKLELKNIHGLRCLLQHGDLGNSEMVEKFMKKMTTAQKQIAKGVVEMLEINDKKYHRSLSKEANRLVAQAPTDSLLDSEDLPPVPSRTLKPTAFSYRS